MRKHCKDNQLIDYIKIIIKDFPRSELERSPLLNFFDTINLNTGELKTTNRNGNRVTPSKKAIYNGLEFTIYDTGTITVSGSLHKYWNNGAHNFNDFNIDAILSVIADLETKFGIQPAHCVLKCLEIGLNTAPPIPTNEIIDNCFLHKTTAFEYQRNSDEGKYKQAQHSQYIIKIYNKALHYKTKGFEINGEILRFEIKYTKMEKLNTIGIFSLEDLINYGLENFKKDLVREWQNVLYFDNTIQIDTLSSRTKNAIRDYSNPNYWTGLLDNNQTKNFTHHKNRLKKITFENSNKVQELMAEVIGNKIDNLNVKTIQNDSLTILSKRIVLHAHQKYVKCPITGLSLVHETKGAKYARTSTLTQLKQSYPATFELVKIHLLSGCSTPKFEQSEIQHLAKQIRNKFYNSFKIKKSGYNNRVFAPEQINIYTLLEI